MGKHNRQRRADKHRTRRRHEARSSGSSPGPYTGPDPGGHHPGPRPNSGSGHDPEQARADAARMLVAASVALRDQDLDTFHTYVVILAEGPPTPDGHGLVDRAVDTVLGQAIGRTWRSGWQPEDVVRVAERKIDRVAASLARDVIAADTATYRTPEIHPRWRDQVSAVGASVWWSPDAPHLGQWARRSSISRADAVSAAIALLAFLHHAPPLPMLCPPPGAANQAMPQAGAWSAPRAASAPMLERIRALLTKAESTTFPEEAEALSVKAQELMATHSIDRIALAAERGEDPRPIGRRIGIDDPYAPAKSVLLGAVASANRCRAVWTQDLGFSTVFGAEADVDAVDVLFTSLLTQATAALQVADRKRAAAGLGRARSFRQSFRVGYAARIGSRLAEVVAATEQAAGASHGADLLPVLAGHEEDVEAAVGEAFPEVAYRSLSASNSGGWAAGMAAAELASLRIHPEVDRTASA